MIRFFLELAKIFATCVWLTADSALVLLRLRTIEPIGTKWRWR